MFGISSSRPIVSVGLFVSSLWIDHLLDTPKIKQVYIIRKSKRGKQIHSIISGEPHGMRRQLQEAMHYSSLKQYIIGLSYHLLLGNSKVREQQ